MSIFNPNIPLSTDILSDSQVDLKNNNGALDTWADVDHYPPSDMTMGVNGLHKHVTSPTPANGMHYSNPGINTILYGMQDNAAIGNIQYSRGSNNAVPSPVTTLQSSSAGISIPQSNSVVVLNFNPAPTPIPYCYGTITAIGVNSNSGLEGISYGFYWNGSNLGGTFLNGSSTTGAGGVKMSASFSGTNLIIFCNSGNMSNVAWTLRFDRIWTPT